MTVLLEEEHIVYIENGVLQNTPGTLYEWYGDEMTKEIEFKDVVSEIKVLPPGEYRLRIQLEKV